MIKMMQSGEDVPGWDYFCQTVGIVPIAGDAIKGILKGGGKVADALTIINKGDKYLGGADVTAEAAKITGKAADATANIKQSAKYIDQEAIKNGRIFDKKVVEQFGLGGTKHLQIEEIADGVRVAFIPDAASNAAKLLIEVKDVKVLNMSNQLRAYFTSADTVSIIVSPKTENISKSVWKAIERTGGLLEVFDPVTGNFSPYVGRVGGRFLK